MNGLTRVYLFPTEAQEAVVEEALKASPEPPARFKDYVQAFLDEGAIARLSREGVELYVGNPVGGAAPAPDAAGDGLSAIPQAGLADDMPVVPAAGLMGDAAPPPPAEPGPKPLARPSKRSDPRLRRRFDRFAAAAPPASGNARLRVSLTGSLTEERRKTLKSLGVKLLNARRGLYQVDVPAARRAELEALPFVAEVRDYELIDSVSTDLLRTLASPPAAGAPARDTFDALAHAASDLSSLKAALAALPDVDIVDASVDAVRFTAPTDDKLLAGIATLPQVRLLTPVKAVSLFMDRARALVGAETVRPAPLGLTGKGEIIAVLDSGIDQGHPDFAGRIKAAVGFDGCSPDDMVGHGLHVAGIAAGSGAQSGGTVAGIAPEAELVVVGIVRGDGRTLALPLDIGTLLEEAASRGAKIVNCSWGTPVGTIYDTASLSTDRFIHAHPDILVVFAAGNSGRAQNAEHQLWTVGSPATAKNALAVAASGTDRPGVAKTWEAYDSRRFPAPLGSAAMTPSADNVALLSSAGPTDTEGVKPDLAAPGVWVLAPRLDGGTLPYTDCADHGGKYAYLHGTSMAAPMVSGAAALLRQFLREKMNLPAPSAALMKALLVNATVPMPPAPHPTAPPIGYPDFDQGYGRLDLATMIPHPAAPAGRAILCAEVANDDAAESLTSGLAPGSPGRSQRRYAFQVAASGDPLRVALSWTDAPGSGVQNDLQLLVTAPDGRQILGNPDHKLDRLFGPPDPGTGFVSDRRNTIEQVRVDAPQPGTWSVRVWARNTIYPRQGYSLAVCGAVQGPLAPTN